MFSVHGKIQIRKRHFLSGAPSPWPLPNSWLTEGIATNEMGRRFRWRPRIALAIWLAQATVVVLRHEGPLAVLRKSRYWIRRATRALTRRGSGGQN